MKLGTVISYLNKIQKLYKSRGPTHEFHWQEHFSSKMSNFFYVKKCRYRFCFSTYFLILFTFLDYFKVILINMVAIYMLSAKLTTLDLLKIKVLWNKYYIIIFYVHDVTNKILWGDSNYIVDMVKWPKFVNFSISIREVIITAILDRFDQKNIFLTGALRIGTGYNLEILQQCGG